MFKYEEPNMELWLLDAEDILTVSVGGDITDDMEEGDTPYVPPVPIS